VDGTAGVGETWKVPWSSCLIWLLLFWEWVCENLFLVVSRYIDGVVLLKRPVVIHVSIVPCMRDQAIMLLCVHDLDHLHPVCDSTWLESLLSLTASRRQQGNISLLLEGP